MKGPSCWRSAPCCASWADSRQIVSWVKPEPGIGYMRIARFSGLPKWRAVLDKGFEELADTHTLILDLRENGGGNLSLGMRLSDHLIPERRSFGLYTSRVGLAGAGVDGIDQFPRDRIATFDGYEQDEFLDMLFTRGAVSLVSGGRAFTRPRRIYILIDKDTGSAAEAVAAELTEQGAILVAERTAGAMLVSVRERVAPEWILRFPAGDFRTGRGAAVEGVGVEPTHPVNPRRAYDIALDMAKKDAPQ